MCEDEREADPSAQRTVEPKTSDDRVSTSRDKTGTTATTGALVKQKSPRSGPAAARESGTAVAAKREGEGDKHKGGSPLSRAKESGPSPADSYHGDAAASKTQKRVASGSTEQRGQAEGTSRHTRSEGDVAAGSAEQKNPRSGPAAARESGVAVAIRRKGKRGKSEKISPSSRTDTIGPPPASSNQDDTAAQKTQAEETSASTGQRTQTGSVRPSTCAEKECVAVPTEQKSPRSGLSAARESGVAAAADREGEGDRHKKSSPPSRAISPGPLPADSYHGDAAAPKTQVEGVGGSTRQKEEKREKRGRTTQQVSVEADTQIDPSEDRSHCGEVGAMAREAQEAKPDVERKDREKSQETAGATPSAPVRNVGRRTRSRGPATPVSSLSKKSTSRRCRSGQSHSSDVEEKTATERPGVDQQVEKVDSVRGTGGETSLDAAETQTGRPDESSKRGGSEMDDGRKASESKMTRRKKKAAAWEKAIEQRAPEEEGGKGGRTSTPQEAGQTLTPQSVRTAVDEGTPTNPDVSLRKRPEKARPGATRGEEETGPRWEIQDGRWLRKKPVKAATNQTEKERPKEGEKHPMDRQEREGKSEGGSTAEDPRLVSGLARWPKPCTVSSTTAGHSETHSKEGNVGRASETSFPRSQPERACPGYTPESESVGKVSDEPQRSNAENGKGSGDERARNIAGTRSGKGEG